MIVVIRDQETNKYRRWILGYVPALIFCTMAIVALDILYSYSLSYQPKQIMERWGCENRMGDENEWNSAYNKMSRAIVLTPWDADAYLEMGNLINWKAATKKSWTKETRDLRKKALEYYQAALIKRPIWALAWANIAQNLFLLGRIDEQGFYALTMGFKYGQSQKDVISKLVWLSVSVWKTLPDNLKSAVRESVKGLQHDDDAFQRLVVMAIRFSWMDELVSLVSNPKRHEYLTYLRANQDSARKQFIKNNKSVSPVVCA